MKEFNEANFDQELEAAPLALVDFWADWCGPCKMMAPHIGRIAEQYEGKALVGKVNVSDEPGLAQKYGVMSIPTFVYFKNGREFDRKMGAQDPENLTAVLDQNL